MTHDARESGNDTAAGRPGEHPGRPTPDHPATPQRISSDSLLGSARELLIEHAGETYHLRCTGKGKLILTK